MNNQDWIPGCHSWTCQHVPGLARHHFKVIWIHDCLFTDLRAYSRLVVSARLSGRAWKDKKKHTSVSDTLTLQHMMAETEENPSRSASFAVQANWRGVSGANMFYIFLGGGKISRVTLLHDHHRDENHVEAPLRSPGKTNIIVLRSSFYCLQNNE